MHTNRWRSKEKGLGNYVLRDEVVARLFSKDRRNEKLKKLSKSFKKPVKEKILTIEEQKNNIINKLKELKTESIVVVKSSFPLINNDINDFIIRLNVSDKVTSANKIEKSLNEFIFIQEEISKGVIDKLTILRKKIAKVIKDFSDVDVEQDSLKWVDRLQNTFTESTCKVAIPEDIDLATQVETSISFMIPFKPDPTFMYDLIKDFKIKHLFAGYYSIPNAKILIIEKGALFKRMKMPKNKKDKLIKSTLSSDQADIIIERINKKSPVKFTLFHDISMELRNYYLVWLIKDRDSVLATKLGNCAKDFDLGIKV